MLFITALNTGLTRGKLLALTWDDIYIDNNTIRVNKAVKYISDVSKEGRGNCNIIIQTPKSEASNRTISIPEHTYATRLFELKEEPKTVQSLF